MENGPFVGWLLSETTHLSREFSFAMFDYQRVFGIGRVGFEKCFQTERVFKNHIHLGKLYYASPTWIEAIPWFPMREISEVAIIYPNKSPSHQAHRNCLAYCGLNVEPSSRVQRCSLVTCGPVNRPTYRKQANFTSMPFDIPNVKPMLDG